MHVKTVLIVNMNTNRYVSTYTIFQNHKFIKQSSGNRFGK